MAEESRLVIAIDSQRAERNLRNVRTELGGLEKASGGVARSTAGLSSSLSDADKAAGRYYDSAGKMREANGRFVAGAKRAGAASDAMAVKNKSAAASFGTLKVAALSVVGTLSAIGATQFFRSVIQEQETLQRNMLRTQQLLETTGRTSNRSAESLLEQARAINDATLNSTEGVMQAQQTLLTFRNITGDAFDQAINGAVDLAAAMGTDLNSAVLQLGKALEDPVTGMTALTRSGTVFTKSQKEMVKELVETGRAAEAQEFILGELAAQYGGVAAREAQGLAGAQDALSKSIQEGKIAIADYLDVGGRAESVYRSLAGGVDRFAGALASGNLDGKIGAIATSAQLLAGVAAGRVASSLGAAAGAKLTAAAAAVRYQAALASMAGASRVAAAGQVALAGATRAAAGALALVGGPVGAAVLGAAALFTFREELGLMLSPAQAAREEMGLLAESIEDVNDATIDGAMIQMNAKLFELERRAREAREKLDSLGDDRSSGALGMAAGATGESARLNAELGQISSDRAAIDQEIERLQALGEGIDKAGESGDKAGDSLERLGQTAEDVVAKFQPMLNQDIESILEGAGPGAKIDQEGRIRDAFGNFNRVAQRELEDALLDQRNDFQSEQNLQAGLDNLLARMTGSSSENAPSLLATNSQDSAPERAGKPMGTFTIRVAKEGEGDTEGTVQGDEDFIKRMASALGGVASAV